MVKITCQINIVAEFVEEAVHRLLLELESVQAAAEQTTDNEPGSAIVDDYHYWMRENEGDVSFYPHLNKNRFKNDWYVDSNIRVEHCGKDAMPRQ